jgi:phosphoglucomutase
MIHFGTSGWRGIVGQEFTFHNVRLVLDATVEVLRARGLRGEVLVSYDTRLLSE